jgi:hypothetical protein
MVAHDVDDEAEPRRAETAGKRAPAFVAAAGVVCVGRIGEVVAVVEPGAEVSSGDAYSAPTPSVSK